MIRINNLYLPPNYDRDVVLKKICRELNCSVNHIKDFEFSKLSVDARNKNDVHFLASVDAEVNNQQKILNRCKSNKITFPKYYEYQQPVCKNTETKTVIAGAGPAGLFAALILARSGMNVSLIERGKSVDDRTKDVELFRNGGSLNTESNIQFGEGGAGTFSDGKLTTGTKDKRIRKVFEEFVTHGAPKDILYEAKPHIGTDKLKPTIKAIRKEITALGGEILFETKLTNINFKENTLTGVDIVQNGESKVIYCHNLILAVGHSARDTFRMLKNLNFSIEAKPFAVGTRIEHLREKIDRTQYGDFYSYKQLGPGIYKLNTRLENGRGVYTFCMCPGGEVVAAQSEKNTVVTNGMSRYARDGVNSNSALLVGVNPKDFDCGDALSGMYFQEEIEKKAFVAGGSDYSAPVQRVGDFLNNKTSKSFGEVLPSYKPSVKFANLDDVLPEFITGALRVGIKDMDRKLNGFAHPDALLTGVESRSSSPIRILRDGNFEAVGKKGVFPCGEGAGYAGGIVSAAVDGIKCAEKIIEKANREIL